MAESPFCCHLLGATCETINIRLFYRTPIDYIPNSTSLPKGASDSAAILKCCLPHGIPITVTQSNNPKNTCIIHDHRPPNNNQRIFRGMRMQPVGLFVSLTFEPNGHRHRRPILNVCIAMGMPIMVIANAKLPVK